MFVEVIVQPGDVRLSEQRAVSMARDTLSSPARRFQDTPHQTS